MTDDKIKKLEEEYEPIDITKHMPKCEYLIVGKDKICDLNLDFRK